MSAVEWLRSTYGVDLNPEQRMSRQPKYLPDDPNAWFVDDDMERLDASRERG